MHAQGASGERWRGAVQSQRKPKLADENLQISLVQQALGIAAAACMLVAPCHADVNTALSFNKNCIGICDYAAVPTEYSCLTHAVLSDVTDLRVDASK